MRLFFPVLVLAVGLAGCSAANTGPEPAETTTWATYGNCLDQLGITTEVAPRICLPSIQLDYSYGSEKTLLVIGPLSSAEAARDYLAETLPTLGWTLTYQVVGPGGPTPEALRFDDDTWQGSFVVGDSSWGLTVRLK